jgi:hypothetical protein
MNKVSKIWFNYQNLWKKNHEDFLEKIKHFLKLINNFLENHEPIFEN